MARNRGEGKEGGRTAGIQEGADEQKRGKGEITLEKPEQLGICAETKMNYSQNFSLTRRPSHIKLGRC